MNYYDEVYNKRLNRFGDNFKDRILGQRIKDFEDLKNSSIYHISFFCDGMMYEGVLQPRKQDETKSQFWLLTSIRDSFDGGALIESENNSIYLILYKDSNETRGYNKYCVIKMTHLVSWERDGFDYVSYAYFYGPMTGFIADTSRVQSRSTGPNAPDPSKHMHLIMPKNTNLRRQDYLEIDGEGFYVTGYDFSSTPGVEYVSLSQTFTRVDQDLEVDEEEREDNEDKFFFLDGGK